MSDDTILGIDPGTRFVGIAVIRGGKLAHCNVRSFQGKWSQIKLQKIIGYLESVIRRDNVTNVMVKIPDMLPISVGFTQLVGSINALCENHGIRPRYKTHSEVKASHCKAGKPTALSLMVAIVDRFPELARHYDKERRNKEAYYRKIFAAVAVAHLG